MYVYVTYPLQGDEPAAVCRSCRLRGGRAATEAELLRSVNKLEQRFFFFVCRDRLKSRKLLRINLT